MTTEELMVTDDVQTYRKWHDIVTKYRNDQQPKQASPSTLPTDGWQKFPGAVVPPNFNKGNIYHYLMETLQAANWDDDDI
ncbi:hypothetical protein LSAT2_009605 [Lamellibrachia satsuma]|nr:hypothetical protein LSAT2_009605 [Lamellibrachia satsuma]